MVQEEQYRDRPPENPKHPPPPLPEERDTGFRRSTWLLLSILLVGLVIALIAWLPAELSRDAEDTPTTSSTTTAPAEPGQATPPAAEPAPAPAEPQTQPPAQ